MPELDWGLRNGTFSCGCCGKSAHGELSYRQALDGMSGAVEIEGIETKPLYGKSIAEYNQKQRAGVVQWQYRSFPSFGRGFDSHRPLHNKSKQNSLRESRLQFTRDLMVDFLCSAANGSAV